MEVDRIFAFHSYFYFSFVGLYLHAFHFLFFRSFTFPLQLMGRKRTGKEEKGTSFKACMPTFLCLVKPFILSDLPSGLSSRNRVKGKEGWHGEAN